jgi:hypothetical protein
MKKEWLVKTFALGVVVLFIVVSVNTTIGVSSYLDDTNPPVTEISFNPPEPDGENGWYVSNVTVTLNATDDDSGVNITKYRVDGGVWYNYIEPFILVNDGEDILIEFYSIDNAENFEDVKSAVIDIDQIKPEIELSYEISGAPLSGYDFTFFATATDYISGMNKVEFYLNNSTGWSLQKTVDGSGPTYQWIYHVATFSHAWVVGLIHNPVITDDYVKFFALFVLVFGYFFDWVHFWVVEVAYDNAGNSNFAQTEYPCFKADISSGIFLFKSLTLPGNYTGYIGKFFVRATFEV